MVRFRLRVLLVAASACSFRTSASTRDGAPSVDSVVDATPDGNDGTGATMRCWSIVELGVSVCAALPLPTSLDVTTDTAVDTGGSCATLLSGSSDVCALVASTIHVAATNRLSASGQRPLVLAAASISIDGTVDVASHGGAARGAGAGGPCDAGMAPTSAGGGQGGSLGTAGGAGGDEHNVANSGGRAGATTSIASLRGGCSGAPGGATGGAGGAGGGVVWLSADTIAISSTGVVNASGQGGAGASAGRRGGGGGGTGGLIVLQAPSITVDPIAALYANGGGGGGGSPLDATGTAGGDPSGATNGGTAGPGGIGAGGGVGGTGGVGYPSTSAGAAASTGTAGGGGGGGGAGAIKVYGASISGGNLSPPPS